MSEILKITEGQVELNRISLTKGDVLVATLTSNEIDFSTLKAFKMVLQAKFPDNEVSVVGLSSSDSIHFKVVPKLE